MQDWVLRPWREAFKFSGRATRREYWLFSLQVALLFGLMLLIAAAWGGTDPTGATAVILAGAFLLFYLFTFVATLSASVRRLHDHDKSGWFYLLSLVPLIGWIFFLIMMLTPGTRGTNSYGRDPREGDAADVGELEQVFS